VDIERAVASLADQQNSGILFPGDLTTSALRREIVALVARRWEGRERRESLLLRGDDLDAAKAWMATRKGGAPEITDAQRALISASEEARRRRSLR